MIFLVVLTLGFRYEYFKGRLKFTDHRSSISRTPIKSPFTRRMYSTKRRSTVIGPQYSNPSVVTKVNPNTGEKYTEQELQLVKLTSLLPISP